VTIVTDEESLLPDSAVHVVNGASDTLVIRSFSAVLGQLPARAHAYGSRVHLRHKVHITQKRRKGHGLLLPSHAERQDRSCRL
jgi:hypothetical protein